MNKISDVLDYIKSEEYIDLLQDRMSLPSRGEYEDLESELQDIKNTLAHTQRELKQAVRLIAALAEGKQLTVVRHAGGTTINVSDPRLDADDRREWEKPSLRIVK